jgi:hypothetical protein
MLGNSIRPMTCQPEWFIPVSWEPEALKEVGQVCEQTASLGDEEGTIQDMWGRQSDGSHGSLTVLDNILTVWEVAGDEERACGPHSCSGGLLKGLGWGYEKLHASELCQGAPALLRVMSEVRESEYRRQPYCERVKTQNVLTITDFFIAIFRK